MQFNWKRIVILILILLLFVVIAFSLYFFLLRPVISPPSPVIPTPFGERPAGDQLPRAGINVNAPITNVNQPRPDQITPPVGPGEIPPTGVEQASEIAQGGLTKTTILTTSPVIGARLSSSGRAIVYYNQGDGRFYQISSDGTAKRLSDKKFFNVSTVAWSPDRSKAVLEYPDGANILYNFETEKQITFPIHWEEFSFAPTGRQLAFKSLGTADQDKWLAITNADGSESQLIEFLGGNAGLLTVDWSPNNQIVASHTKGIDFNQQNLFFVGPNNERYPLTIIEGRDYRSQWSPQGDRLLYSVYSANSNYLPSLWIVDAQGDLIGKNRRNLGLATWSNKCAFGDNEIIYCAVPRDLPQNAGLMRQEFRNVVSDIYRIDLRSGFRSLIATPDDSQNIESLIISEDDRFLYFVGAEDGLIHQIRLR